MRTAITIGIEHGGKKASLMFGPEVGIDDQYSEFKKLPEESQVHEKFERVEVWESDSGCCRYRGFLTKKARDARDSSLKNQHDEHESFKASEETRNSGKTSDRTATKRSETK